MSKVDSIQHTCTLCGHETALAISNVFDVRFGIDQTCDIEICTYCSLEQLFPRPDSAQLTEYYNRYYNFSGHKDSRYSTLRESFLFSPLYRLWLSIDGDISFHRRRGSGRLLDIGCNEGRGLLFYRRNGYDAEGLELNDVAAAAARFHGFTVHSQLLEEFHPSHIYDVAVLSNVLEHSLGPRNMLRHVSRILKPGGEVWISCPNRSSWLRLLFGRYWINWHVPFHIVHFSQNNLQSLLRESGFEVIDNQHKTPAAWAAFSLIAWLFSRQAKPTLQLRNPLLVAGLMLLIRGFLFPVLWIGNKLGRSDCLVVRARK